jgi:hypothetical protein
MECIQTGNRQQIENNVIKSFGKSPGKPYIDTLKYIATEISTITNHKVDPYVFFRKGLFTGDEIFEIIKDLFGKKAIVFLLLLEEIFDDKERAESSSAISYRSLSQDPEYLLLILRELKEDNKTISPEKLRALYQILHDEKITNGQSNLPVELGRIDYKKYTEAYLELIKYLGLKDPETGQPLEPYEEQDLEISVGARFEKAEIKFTICPIPGMCVEVAIPFPIRKEGIEEYDKLLQLGPTNIHEFYKEYGDYLRGAISIKVGGPKRFHYTHSPHGDRSPTESVYQSFMSDPDNLAHVKNCIRFVAEMQNRLLDTLTDAINAQSTLSFPDRVEITPDGFRVWVGIEENKRITFCCDRNGWLERIILPDGSVVDCSSWDDDDEYDDEYYGGVLKLLKKLSNRIKELSQQEQNDLIKELETKPDSIPSVIIDQLKVMEKAVKKEGIKNYQKQNITIEEGTIPKLNQYIFTFQIGIDPLVIEIGDVTLRINGEFRDDLRKCVFIQELTKMAGCGEGKFNISQYYKPGSYVPNSTWRKRDFVQLKNPDKAELQKNIAKALEYLNQNPEIYIQKQANNYRGWTYTTNLDGIEVIVNTTKNGLIFSLQLNGNLYFGLSGSEINNIDQLVVKLSEVINKYDNN